VNFDAAVLALVARIPRGRVATYGQLAALVGKPRSARAVGQVMSRADGVPWHRVVNSQGGISRRSRMTGMVTQRIRLEQEGVVFRRGRVVLSRFRWNGAPLGAARRRALRAVGAPPLAAARLSSESGSHDTGRATAMTAITLDGLSDGRSGSDSCRDLRWSRASGRLGSD